ncbi:AMP-binding protein [Hyalangium sp.]|uniref:AMP-binding protein n=1 Tax=Hyalangium sp. TaxID=2028555 RepID=UPI002D24C529|nr:AMP-binding protein [Hyalangium sp.]HYI03050.1 AMP-binding protein [Hyalangium sp.]
MSDSLYARVLAADPQRGLFLYEDFADTPTFISYAELPARIAACAAHFRQQGVQPGDRILFPFETSATLIVSFLGLLELGAVPLSVKPYILSTPKQAYQDFLLRIAERHRVSLFLDAPSLKSLELPLRRVPLPPAGARLETGGLRAPSPETLAFVQFSSGSTSHPKGVPVTWGALVANLRMFTTFHRFSSSDRGCTWLPLYHDMGLVASVLACVYGGCDIHIAQPTSFLMNPVGWLEFMSKCRTTLTIIPNFAVDYLLKYLEAEELERLELSALRCCGLGSEPINIPNLERFMALLAPRGLQRTAIRPSYGMAEAVVAVACTGSQPLRVITGPNGQQAISVGPPLSGFEVRLRSEDGRLCGERELGEIELRGGSLAASYFEHERPLLGAEAFYSTGDLGFMDGGELFITGRVNDRIKINGQSYFSSDFEQAIERLPFIRPGRTVVIQTQGRMVVLAELHSLAALEQRAQSQQQVCAAIMQSVGVSVAPQDVLFIRYGQIQKTSSGKLRRRAMTEAYEQGRIRVSTPMGLRADQLRMRGERLFYGSLIEARKRGSRWLESGRAVFDPVVQRVRAVLKPTTAPPSARGSGRTRPP